MLGLGLEKLTWLVFLDFFLFFLFFDRALGVRFEERGGRIVCNVSSVVFISVIFGVFGVFTSLDVV